MALTQVQQLQHSLGWAMSIVATAPAAADTCTYHGRVPHTHICSYYQNTEWQTALTAMGSLLSSTWNWLTTAGSPTAGQVKTNTNDWANATQITIHSTDGAGTPVDQTVPVQNIQAGTYLKLQLNAGNYASYLVTSVASVVGSVYTFNVSRMGQKGSPPNSGTGITFVASVTPL